MPDDCEAENHVGDQHKAGSHWGWGGGVSGSCNASLTMIRLPMARLYAIFTQEERSLTATVTAAAIRLRWSTQVILLHVCLIFLLPIEILIPIIEYFEFSRFKHANPEDPSEVPKGFLSDINEVWF